MHTRYDPYPVAVIFKILILQKFSANQCECTTTKLAERRLPRVFS